MKDSFSAYHPIVNFVFYGLILGISMFFMHPVLMTISALGALSMVFRFVPRFYAQMAKVSSAQKCIGRDVTNGSVKQKLHQGIKILSIMVTWSLENSVETADSMKSRGYGLRGRTNFHLYSFEKRDKALLVLMVLAFLWIVVGITSERIFVLYYPVFSMNEWSLYAVIGYILYGIVCFLPMILNIAEDIKWHYLKSKI